MVKSGHTLVSLTVVIVVAACGGAPAIEPDESAIVDYRSNVLGTGYEDALDVGSQLALGTLLLEETGQAVTPEQAKALLPFWRALQGGVVLEGEISAVLKGIEGAMTEEQLVTIAAMHLTEEDMQTQMEQQGPGVERSFPGMDGDPDARATRQAGAGGERESMSEEEREAMMATVRAGGGMGRGSRGEAEGVAGAVAGGLGRIRLLIRPLVELLSQRAEGSGS